MDGRFDRRLSSIFVFGSIEGPTGKTRVRLAVDTGSTRTVIRSSILRYVGCDMDEARDVLRMTSATGVERVGMARLHSLTALGHTRMMNVVAHELPATFEGHGLLGRDFFQDQLLSIDFLHGIVTLRSAERPWWRFWR